MLAHEQIAAALHGRAIGFAHAFKTLERDPGVIYKVSNIHAPQYDAGNLWNDPDRGIAWPIDAAGATLSDKGLKLARLRGIASPLEG